MILFSPGYVTERLQTFVEGQGGYEYISITYTPIHASTDAPLKYKGSLEKLYLYNKAVYRQNQKGGKAE